VAPLRLTLEAGVGQLQRSDGLPTQDGRRRAIDLRYATALGNGLRLALSDRLDDTHPALPMHPSTVNSLREAFIEWHGDSAAALADVAAGRINLRNGPAFGYNPTDYFRTGALRTLNTADPVALRENRLGVAMLRLGRPLRDGELTLALAPKLADAPSHSGLSLDLGATNTNSRALLSTSQRLSSGFNGQVLLLAERGAAPQIGASATALVSDAAVAYGEYSRGRAASLQDIVLGAAAPATPMFAHAALGMTYTLPTQTSLTLEAEFNGAGLETAGWQHVLAHGPAALSRYYELTQSSQEPGFRRNCLFYVAQKGFVLKQLDLTAFVRLNVKDRSRLAWAELRYHWTSVDLALQWQRSSGSAQSEFGIFPYRQTLQAIGFIYF
jgi:hypothetical protein